MQHSPSPKIIVSCFIFNNQGELFLMESPKWQNQYLIPGGHLEYGETLTDCCRREVKEETGLNLYQLKFFSYLDGIKPPDYFRKNVHFVYLYFIAKTKSNKIILDDREGQAHLFVKPKKSLSLNNLHPEIKKLIQKIIKEKYVR